MKVSCIIPAYNEENTIGNVIEAAKAVEFVKSIIVVSDGSTDKTADIARKHGATVIELEKNCGKGGAMKVGIENSNEETLLFLDGDLIGLTDNHIMDLLYPVLYENKDMAIGIFSNGRFMTDLAQTFTPKLSGQRAVKRQILSDIDKLESARYGVEVILNRKIKNDNIKYDTVDLPYLTHVMKEEKLGFKKGITARFKMYWDILKCMV